MLIREDAFDRDLALFHATSQMSRFRENPAPALATLSIQSTPRLAQDTFGNSDPIQILFVRSKAVEIYRSLKITGTTKVAIISSQIDAQWKPGTLIELENKESLELSIKEYSNHFIVYQGGEVCPLELDHTLPQKRG